MKKNDILSEPGVVAATKCLRDLERERGRLAAREVEVCVRIGHELVERKERFDRSGDLTGWTRWLETRSPIKARNARRFMAMTRRVKKRPALAVFFELGRTKFTEILEVEMPDTETLTGSTRDERMRELVAGMRELFPLADAVDDVPGTLSPQAKRLGQAVWQEFWRFLNGLPAYSVPPSKDERGERDRPRRKGPIRGGR